MKTKLYLYFFSVCLAGWISTAFCCGDNESRIILSKTLDIDGANVPYEVTIRAFEQTIEKNDVLHVRTGRLIELLQKGSSPVEQDRVVWHTVWWDAARFPTTLSADLIVARSGHQLFLALSSGPGFGIHRVDPAAAVTPIAERVVIRGMPPKPAAAPRTAERSDIFPTRDMTRQIMWIASISIALEGDEILVFAQQKGRETLKFRYCLKMEKWLNEEAGDPSKK